jgi:hypothetical protein
MNNAEVMIRVMGANEARVHVTYSGHFGELPDPVQADAPESDIKAWVTEALRGGGIPGIPMQPNADLTDFVLERFAPAEGRPTHVLSVRPKTPFGAVR